MFCKKCGKQIADDSMFCPFCGEKVGIEKTESDDSKRKVVFEGEVRKCPNCGEILKSFEAVCPSCGFELRNSKNSKAIEEFSKKLQEIESKRTVKPKGKAVAEAFGRAFGVGSTDTVDKEIINLIRSFNVPNNKEDICEFLILACSNINETVALADNYNEAGANSESEFSSLKAVNDAWVAKATQVYQKAKISFGNESSFKEVETIYLNKISSLKKANTTREKKRRRIIIGCIIALIAIFVVIFVMAYFEKQGMI